MVGAQEPQRPLLLLQGWLGKAPHGTAFLPHKNLENHSEGMRGNLEPALGVGGFVNDRVELGAD